MTCLLKPQAVCLPVTALRSLRLGHQTFLLAGQGPHLQIHSKDGLQLLSAQVFESQSIHGIGTSSVSITERGAHRVCIIFWGSAKVRLGWLEVRSLDVTESQDSGLRLTFARAVTLDDWILDACFVDFTIYMLTAHNVLVETPILENEGANVFETKSLSVICGPKSFLYSGSVVVAGPRLIIVASGTVFGEIVVWTCTKEENELQWTTSIRSVFKGHSGSVFGVAISDTFNQAGSQRRLLASCSDDRTVKIWDISSCDQSFQEETPHYLTSTDTGFGAAPQGDRSHLASAWGHLSRIWGVEFVQKQGNGKDCDMFLFSRGEDGVCQLWSLKPGQHIEPTLAPRFNDRHHYGKNAWSMCQFRDGQELSVYTGGADGQIISRTIKDLDSNLDDSLTVSAAFKDITNSSKPLKNYLLINDRTCVATTDAGDLFLLSTSGTDLSWAETLGSTADGGLLPCTAEETGLTLIAHQRGGISALLKDQSALVRLPFSSDCGFSWIQVAGQHPARSGSSTTCVVAVLAKKDVVILWVTIEESSHHCQIDRTDLQLPDTFAVTACSYDYLTQLLLLGSRAGALAVYAGVTPESKTSGEAFCLRHIHGTDSVTSIKILEPASWEDVGAVNTVCILSTGRDGHYALHSLGWPSSTMVGEPTVLVIHHSTPPFGPNIEGAYFIPSAGSSPRSQPDLILFGFRSTSFIVWNETQQSTILTIECGGSHRTWAYRDSCALLGSSLTSSARRELESANSPKSFVWTKAGRFNWYVGDKASRHKVLQHGGHGREIKTVACSRIPYNDGDKYLQHYTLIATGAEDTNIQLFILSTSVSQPHDPRQDANMLSTATDNPSSRVGFQSVGTLKRHTTGLQHLQFSQSGRYLFSSAGCEEFYIWKLTYNVPCIGFGTVLWDTMPTEEGGESDARIMSFDIYNGEKVGDGISEQSETFLVAMAYSTGKVKVVHYSPSPTSRDRGIFTTLREINYGSFCVMQAFFLSPSPSAQSLRQRPTHILSAGTNGFLNLSAPIELGLPESGNPQTRAENEMAVHRTHQSSVLAMDIVSLAEGTYLVATGGDDNALALSLLTWTSTGSLHRFSTVLIPRAHAAAVTALKITESVTSQSESGTAGLVVVTAGNDQRVRVWNVQVDLTQSQSNGEDDKLCEAIQVKRVGSSWTSVADVSGLELVQGKDDGDGLSARQQSGVLVVGVGMELLSVEWS